MDQRPPLLDRYRIRAIRRWYSVCWVFLGLFPLVLADTEESTAVRYGSMGLLAVLALSWAVLESFPDNRVMRPVTFLCVLVVGLGGVSGLRGASASLLIATLPQFWIFARSPRAAIAFSGAATAATVGGNLLWRGWTAESVTGNAVVALLSYAAAVLLGLLMHRIAEQGQERASRLGEELAAAQQRLAEAQRRQGATDERERLAREIHDTLAQGFASIIVLAEAARSALDTDPARAAQQLTSIEQTARENFAEARVLVGSAPRSGIAPGSVAAALRRTLGRFAEDTGLTVEAELPDLDCDQQTRIALLRCTQESLANVRKHAGATTVGVVLAKGPEGTVELEITDDGRGFVVGDSRGFGLDGMRRRLAELGGRLTVTSSVGDGTRVLASVPAHGEG